LARVFCEPRTAEAPSIRGINPREERTIILAPAARVPCALGDPALEGRTRHPDRTPHPDDRQFAGGKHRKDLRSPNAQELSDFRGFQ
jgi:hypothetical protein